MDVKIYKIPFLLAMAFAATHAYAQQADVATDSIAIESEALATETPSAEHDSILFIIQSENITATQPSGELTQPSPSHISTIVEEGTEELIAGPEEPITTRRDTIKLIDDLPASIYGKPASWTYSDPWWHGMWINTAVITGGYISMLFILEMLPEDTTAWNRAEISRRPFYQRWYDNVFKKGPEWDHDLFIFNYVLHPYAGAAYFMCGRTCGFNFWQSMLISAAISTIGWEFGIEACMERPSYQDLFITPIVGSLIGEGFYRAKRYLVNHDYELLGSKAIGHIVAVFLDPVNEVLGFLSPDKCRNLGPNCVHMQPLLIPSPAPGESSVFGISLSASF